MSVSETQNLVRMEAYLVVASSVEISFKISIQGSNLSLLLHVVDHLVCIFIALFNVPFFTFNDLLGCLVAFIL